MQPHILVINLDRDAERLAHMQRQLASAGLAFTRFAAIKGSTLPGELVDYFHDDGGRLTAGEVGCYASHLKIATMVAAGDLPAPLLVLEDDVELSLDFARVVDRVVICAPAGWDIVRLSFPTKRATLRIAALTPITNLVRYSHVPMSTGAYLISVSGARKFIAKRKRNLPVDHDLRRVWAWGLDAYGVAPPPVKNDCVGASSIDAITPGGRDRTARRTRFRLERWLEGPRRYARGIRDCGLLAWFGLLVVNLVCRLTPRERREHLLAWAGVVLGRQKSSTSEPTLQSTPGLNSRAA